jgi:hypothetical protein
MASLPGARSPPPAPGGRSLQTVFRRQKLRRPPIRPRRPPPRRQPPHREALSGRSRRPRGFARGRQPPAHRRHRSLIVRRASTAAASCTCRRDRPRRSGCCRQHRPPWRSCSADWQGSRRSARWSHLNGTLWSGCDPQACSTRLRAPVASGRAQAPSRSAAAQTRSRGAGSGRPREWIGRPAYGDRAKQ